MALSQTLFFFFVSSPLFLLLLFILLFSLFLRSLSWWALVGRITFVHSLCSIYCIYTYLTWQSQAIPTIIICQFCRSTKTYILESHHVDVTVRCRRNDKKICVFFFLVSFHQVLFIVFDFGVFRRVFGDMVIFNFLQSWHVVMLKRMPL